VRDIARVLDIRGPSLYAHVASKEDVLWAIVDRVASRFETAADAATAEAPDPDNLLAGLVRAHVLVVAEDVGEASVFIHEWRYLSDDRRQAVLERRDAYESRFRAAIANGIASGAFALTDPSLAATFLLTALNGIPTWYRPGGAASPAQLADLYADLAVRSLTEASQ
jgi:TetR/AcrR family transcriptional regulator, cholesterol catabolism regulator